MRGQQPAQPLRETASTFHRRMSGNEKHDILSHQAQDGLDIACCSSTVPFGDEIPDSLFVWVHCESRDDVQSRVEPCGARL